MILKSDREITEGHHEKKHQEYSKEKSSHDNLKTKEKGRDKNKKVVKEDNS